MHNNISLYDQTFNRQYSLGMRKWDGKRMAWLPEASDHPLQGKKNHIRQNILAYWQQSIVAFEKSIAISIAYAV